MEISGVDILKALLKAANVSASQFFVIVGCTAPTPDPLTKGACLFGAIDMYVSMATLGSIAPTKDDIRDEAKKIKSKLQDVDQRYQQRMTELPGEDINSTRSKLKEMFLGLCEEVKKQCMPD